MSRVVVQPSIQFTDDAGIPLSGGSVALYMPGTTTPINSYQDPDLTVLNTNPITLDAGGRAVIYGTGNYRMVVRDALGNLVYDKVSNDPAASSTGAVASDNLSIAGILNVGGTIYSNASGAFNQSMSTNGTAWSERSSINMTCVSSVSDAGLAINIYNPMGNRGTAAKATGLAAPSSYGIIVQGNGPYEHTAGFIISSATIGGGSFGAFNRGIAMSGKFNQSVYQDGAVADKAIELYGQYNTAIDLTAANASIGIGLANTQQFVWAPPASNPSIGGVLINVDVANNLNLGVNCAAIFTGNHIIPGANNVYSCGSGSLKWAAVNATTLYSSTGTVSTSDPKFKDDIQKLPDVIDLINQVTPVTFKWNEVSGHPDDRTNWGFLATDIKSAFDGLQKDFGGYVENDDTKGLKYEQLIAVLWKGLQEVSAQLAALKDK